MALNRQQKRNAQTIFTLGRQAGLPPNRARELVAAAYAESGLNPRARNTSSGAAGLFQLLSSGYVKQANRRGGVYNPVANTKAILSDYVNYWKRHPGAAPGEAGRDVELSGEGAGFYSSPLAKLGDLGVPAPPPRPRPQRTFGGVPGGVSIPGFSMPGLNVPSVQLPKGLGVSFNQSMKTLGLPNLDFSNFNLPPIKIPGFNIPAQVPRKARQSANGKTAPTISDQMGGYPTARRGKIIGVPYQGTHTIGNWQSDNAVDISVPKGTPIRAVTDGTIGPRIGSFGTSNPRFAGLRVTVQGGGNAYYYAHLSRLTVKAGQRVKKGQIIGYSGVANGVPHLHFAAQRGDPRNVWR